MIDNRLAIILTKLKEISKHGNNLRGGGNVEAGHKFGGANAPFAPLPF